MLQFAGHSCVLMPSTPASMAGLFYEQFRKSTAIELSDVIIGVQMLRANAIRVLDNITGRTFGSASSLWHPSRSHGYRARVKLEDISN